MIFHWIWFYLDSEDDIESQHDDEESNPSRKKAGHDENRLHSVFEAVTYMRCLEKKKKWAENEKITNFCEESEKKIQRLYNKYRTPIIICMTLIFLEITILAYLSAYIFLNNLTQPAQTVTVSSEGPAAEMYPDYMGQYKVLREVYRYDRAVYKHVDREDRFIIFAGKIRLGQLTRWDYFYSEEVKKNRSSD